MKASVGWISNAGRFGTAVWLLAASGVASAAGGTVSGTVDVTPAKYASETVVRIKEVPGRNTPKTAIVDQKGMVFLPHVLAITAGDTVDFANHDSVSHNVYSTDNEGFNLGSFPPNEKRPYTFRKTGVYSLLCSIHPEMLGFVVVNQNRYAAVVDKSGHYSIDNVPPGTYQLEVWNSHAKAPPQTITVAEGKPVTANFSAKK